MKAIIKPKPIVIEKAVLIPIDKALLTPSIFPNINENTKWGELSLDLYYELKVCDRKIKSIRDINQSFLD